MVQGEEASRHAMSSMLSRGMLTSGGAPAVPGHREVELPGLSNQGEPWWCTSLAEWLGRIGVSIRMTARPIGEPGEPTGDNVVARGQCWSNTNMMREGRIYEVVGFLSGGVNVIEWKGKVDIHTLKLEVGGTVRLVATEHTRGSGAGKVIHIGELLHSGSCTIGLSADKHNADGSNSARIQSIGVATLTMPRRVKIRGKPEMLDNWAAGAIRVYTDGSFKNDTSLLDRTRGRRTRISVGGAIVAYLPGGQKASIFIRATTPVNYSCVFPMELLSLVAALKLFPDLHDGVGPDCQSAINICLTAIRGGGQTHGMEQILRGH
jgi:hypothetical protein